MRLKIAYLIWDCLWCVVVAVVVDGIDAVAGIVTMNHEKQMIANFVEKFHLSDNNGNDDDNDNGHTRYSEIYVFGMKWQL